MYLPTAETPAEVALGTLAGPRVRAAWFDPRIGEEVQVIGEYPAAQTRSFAPPAGSGPAADWILTLDSVKT